MSWRFDGKIEIGQDEHLDNVQAAAEGAGRVDSQHSFAALHLAKQILNALGLASLPLRRVDFMAF